MEDDMPLCWVCRDFYKQKHLMDQIYPDDHCHHEEPEEKPLEKSCCLCNNFRINTGNVTWHFESTTGVGFSNMLVKFCPECGRKLNG